MGPIAASVRKGSRRWWPALVWAAVAIAFWVVASESGPGVPRLVAGWLAEVATHSWGVPVFLGFYLLRPLLLLPITVLTLFAGFLFGVPLGLVVAMAGTATSCTVAYALAALVGRAADPRGPWVERLRRRTFETVAAACLAFFPGDLVNGTAGALRLSYPAFLAGTLVGGLPGTAMAVFAGASLEGVFRFEGLRLRPDYLALSISLGLLSLVLSYFLRRRH